MTLMKNLGEKKKLYLPLYYNSYATQQMLPISTQHHIINKLHHICHYVRRLESVFYAHQAYAVQR